MKNSKFDAKPLLEEISAYCRWRINRGLCNNDDCLFCTINRAYKEIEETAGKSVVTVRIYGIKWDTDGDKSVKLPKEVKHTFVYNEDDDELDDVVSDWLSDEYGFCHKGFRMKEVED